MKLSNEDSHQAKVAHVEELAKVLYENRHRFPKKPLKVTHIRTNKWYTDLFELTSPLQREKSILIFDLFSTKLQNQVDFPVK
jgi:hypothetical protein